MKRRYNEGVWDTIKGLFNGSKENKVKKFAKLINIAKNNNILDSSSNKDGANIITDWIEDLQIVAGKKNIENGENKDFPFIKSLEYNLNKKTSSGKSLYDKVRDSYTLAANNDKKNKEHAKFLFTVDNEDKDIINIELSFSGAGYKKEPLIKLQCKSVNKSNSSDKESDNSKTVANTDGKKTESKIKSSVSSKLESLERKIEKFEKLFNGVKYANSKR